MSQQQINLLLHSIVTCAAAPGKVYQYHLAMEDKKAFGRDFWGCPPHYGKRNIRMPLREQTGKECFILIVVPFVRSGFAMTIFQKKKISVPTVARVK